MENDPVAALNLDVRSQTDTEAELHFTLPPELIFFEGHFPSRPILPGVAQAHLAVLIAQKLWGDWPSDANLARLKFRRVLFPNDKVVLRLKRDAKIGRIGFTYTFGDIDASQGEIGGFKR
jgi:3-hydroxymyristoyl/3-hydroxydecanoyl-(acyl carrier protein) dehydratase